MSDVQPADNVPEEGLASPENSDVLPYEDRFPALAGVLDTYFAPESKQSPEEFVERYWAYGEDVSEFEGLDSELREAIRSPGMSSELVNAALGTALGRGEVRHMLSEQRDILLRRGAFSEEALEEQQQEEEEAEQASAREVISGSFQHKITVPFGRWKGQKVQLWHIFAAGVAAVVLGTIPLQLFSLPGWLIWIPFAMISLGVLTAFFSGVAILGLRSELMDGQTSSQKQESKKKDKEDSKKDDDKPGLSERIRRMLT